MNSLGFTISSSRFGSSTALTVVQTIKMLGKFHRNRGVYRVQRNNLFRCAADETVRLWIISLIKFCGACPWKIYFFQINLSVLLRNGLMFPMQMSSELRPGFDHCVLVEQLGGSFHKIFRLPNKLEARCSYSEVSFHNFRICRFKGQSVATTPDVKMDIAFIVCVLAGQNWQCLDSYPLYSEHR